MKKLMVLFTSLVFLSVVWIVANINSQGKNSKGQLKSEILNDEFNNLYEHYRYVDFLETPPSLDNLYKSVTRGCVADSLLYYPHNHKVSHGKDRLLLYYAENSKLHYYIFNKQSGLVQNTGEMPIGDYDTKNIRMWFSVSSESTLVVVNSYTRSIEIIEISSNEVVDTNSFPEFTNNIIYNDVLGDFIGYREIADDENYEVFGLNADMSKSWSQLIPFELNRIKFEFQQYNLLNVSSSGNILFRQDGGANIYKIDPLNITCHLLTSALKFDLNRQPEELTIADFPILQFGETEDLFWYTRMVQGRYMIVFGNAITGRKYVIRSGRVQSPAEHFEYDFLIAEPNGVNGNSLIMNLTKEVYTSEILGLHDPDVLHSYWKNKNSCAFSWIEYELNLGYLESLSQEFKKSLPGTQNEFDDSQVTIEISPNPVTQNGTVTFSVNVFGIENFDWQEARLLYLCGVDVVEILSPAENHFSGEWEGTLSTGSCQNEFGFVVFLTEYGQKSTPLIISAN